MKIKKIALVIFLFVISLNLIYASIETDWIIQEHNKRDRTTEESALALLAVNKQVGSASSLQPAAVKLKNYLDTCIAANNCNNKDAALAILALKEIKDTSTTLETATNWLINSRTIFAPDTDADDWLVQIIAPTSGDCVVNNTEAKLEKAIQVSADYTPWVSVKDLVTQNTNDLVIDCSSLNASTNSISLIKKKTISNVVNYFIREEIQSQRSAGVQLGVPCWGPTYRSICNQDITSYVLLALSKQGKNPDPSWLEEQKSSSLHAAVLYELTKRQEYLSELQSSQSQSGFWQPVDVATTSLIYSFMPQESTTAKKALSWIQSQRSQEGCWPTPSNLCNLKSTASAVYATSQATTAVGTQQANVTSPQTNRTQLEDCDEPCLDKDGCICTTNCKRSAIIAEDETCEGPKSTTPSTSGTYCITEKLCDGQLDNLGRCIDVPGDSCPKDDNEQLECNDDGICDSSEDCSCFDCSDEACFLTGGKTGVCNYAVGICESDDGATIKPDGKKDGKGETEQEEKSSTLFWFLMVIAALIALVGGSYLAYKKGLIKFKKKPSPEYKPRMKIPEELKTPQQYRPKIRSTQKPHPVKKFLDNELDKSIDELEKLLK